MGDTKQAMHQDQASNEGNGVNPVAMRTEKQRLVEGIMGKYAWISYSSEDFIRDKSLEIALENRA